MGLGICFGEDLLVLPVLAPFDNGSSDVRTTPVSVSKAHRVTFGIQFGVLTSSSVAIYVEETSASGSTTNGEEMSFRYRLSEAVGGDTWGAITTASTTGLLISESTGDNQMLLIDIDPSSMTAPKTFLSVRIAAGSVTPALVSAFVVLQPRYAQLDIAVTT